MSQVRLSLCIATLNRAAFLVETLENLLSQSTEEVELIIVDGASTDNTTEVVQAAQAKYGRVRYLRLDKKGGVDADYCRAAAMAAGEYIWLFTDDDLLKPGAIAQVLEAMRSGYSLILLNAEVRSKDLALCLQDRRVATDKDRVYSAQPADQNQLLADAGVYLTFIGGVIIRREIWEQREKEKYFGTEFIHAGVIFQKPLPGETLVVAYPWITIRYGNAQWVSRGFRIAMFNWPNLIWSFGDFAEWAREKASPREPWLSYQQLVFERSLGRYGPKEYETLLAPLITSPIRRLLSRAIAATPAGLVNAVSRFYAKRILRKDPSIGLYDLEAWNEARKAKKG